MNLVRVDSESGERWAVFFVGNTGAAEVLGSTLVLDKALALAKAWWALRRETRSGAEDGAVAVASIRFGWSDPARWHALLDAEGWHGVDC